MIKFFSKFAFAAAFGFAMAFTFGCSSDDGDPSPTPAISSSGGGSSSSRLNSSSSRLGSSSSSSVCTSNSNSIPSEVVYGTPVTYNGETYKTVVIGEQTWFQRNLNYDVEGSECYIDDPANCAIYGRLYNWSTAMSVCPSGWHLPSKDEWGALVTAAGGSSIAGRHLKATSGWDDDYYKGCSGNGEDTYGFSALPGGSCGGGCDRNIGAFGTWWSSSEWPYDDHGYRLAMWSIYESATSYDSGKDNLLSVRCLKD